MLCAKLSPELDVVETHEEELSMAHKEPQGTVRTAREKKRAKG